MRVEIVCFAVKFLGCASVLAGCAATGILWCMDINGRKRMLEEFYQMLLKMQGDIRYLNEPLYNVLSNLKRGCQKEYAQFFEGVLGGMNAQKGHSFISLWDENVDVYLKPTPLKGDDLVLFKDLGRMLGSHDKKLQTQILTLFEKRFEQQIQGVSVQMESKKRLYTGLWMLGGIFIVVLFI